MEHPGVKIMRLGIGNTTEPLTESVVKSLHHGVDKLADVKTYTGYGDEQGDQRLRHAISEFYSKRNIAIAEDEVFVSDGAKPDAANIQSIIDNAVCLASTTGYDIAVYIYRVGRILHRYYAIVMEDGLYVCRIRLGSVAHEDLIFCNSNISF